MASLPFFWLESSQVQGVCCCPFLWGDFRRVCVRVVCMYVCLWQVSVYACAFAHVYSKRHPAAMFVMCVHVQIYTLHVVYMDTMHSVGVCIFCLVHTSCWCVQRHLHSAPLMHDEHVVGAFTSSSVGAPTLRVDLGVGNRVAPTRATYLLSPLQSAAINNDIISLSSCKLSWFGEVKDTLHTCASRTCTSLVF